MSITNINPETYLGFGTWQLWGAGRVPIGVNTSDTDFNIPEKTGGNKSINLSHVHTTGNHTLVTSEIPSHIHYTAGEGANNSTDLNGDWAIGYYATSNLSDLPYSLRNASTAEIKRGRSSATGGNGAHNHGNTGNAGVTAQNIMNPYITCYMFKRLA